MSLHRASVRLIFTSLGGLAVAGLPLMTGCDSPGVGTSPSTRQQVAEVLSKEGAPGDPAGSGKAGKGGPGPQSIKKKLYATEGSKSQ